MLICPAVSESISSLASGDLTLPSSDRQIWPPSSGLSSTTATFARAEAATAADIPAAPPPITMISAETLLIGRDLHSVPGEHIAASLQGDSVDRNAAFKAHAHSAQRAANFACHRTSKAYLSSRDNGCGDGCAVFNRDRLVIYS